MRWSSVLLVSSVRKYFVPWMTGGSLRHTEKCNAFMYTVVTSLCHRCSFDLIKEKSFREKLLLKTCGFTGHAGMVQVLDTGTGHSCVFSLCSSFDWASVKVGCVLWHPQHNPDIIWALVEVSCVWHSKRPADQVKGLLSHSFSRILGSDLSLDLHIRCKLC